MQFQCSISNLRIQSSSVIDGSDLSACMQYCVLHNRKIEILWNSINILHIITSYNANCATYDNINFCTHTSYILTIWYSFLSSPWKKRFEKESKCRNGDWWGCYSWRRLNVALTGLPLPIYQCATVNHSAVPMLTTVPLNCTVLSTVRPQSSTVNHCSTVNRATTAHLGN